MIVNIRRAGTHFRGQGTDVHLAGGERLHSVVVSEQGVLIVTTRGQLGNPEDFCVELEDH